MKKKSKLTNKKFIFKPIDFFCLSVNEMEQIKDKQKIISQGNIFLQYFKLKIFEEYEIKNYINFKFIINKLIELNDEYDTFTKIPIIISPDIEFYNHLHSMLKLPDKYISKEQGNQFLFDKVCVLLGWFNIDNINNEIIEFL